MFGLGFTEIIVILVVALLVFGPERLPEISQSLGRTLGAFRRSVDDIKADLNLAALVEPEERPPPRLRSTPINREEEKSGSEG